MSGIRVDLCHLLDPPTEGWSRLAVLGAEPDLVAAIVDTALAAEVRTDAAAVDVADAVLVRHGAAQDVADLARRLRPGAVMAVEVRGAPGRRGVGRRLRAAGVVVRSRHWALPDLAQARRYVPLDHAGALRWWARSILAVRSPALRAARRALLAGGPRLAVLAASAQVVVVTRPRPGTDPPQGPARLVLTSGNDARSRTVVCDFPPGATRPERVRKVPTHPSGNEVVAAEQESLAAVRARLPAAAAAAVPRPLGTARTGGLVAGVESGVPGTSLVASSGRGGAAAVADLELAASWLRDLATATRSEGRWDAAAVAAWLPVPGEADDPGGAGARLATAVAAIARPGPTLVQAWRHHDFGPWNLFRDDRRLHVVDWEWWPPPADRAGPALADLVYFVTYWLHVAEARHSPEAHAAAVRALWVDAEAPTPLAASARAVVAREATALGVPASTLPLVVAHTWLDQAAHVAQRRRALGPLAPRPPAHAARVVEVLADHAVAFARTTARIGAAPPAP